jgi:hypothetical protein
MHNGSSSSSGIVKVCCRALASASCCYNYKHSYVPVHCNASPKVSLDTQLQLAAVT